MSKLLPGIYNLTDEQYHSLGSEYGEVSEAEYISASRIKQCMQNPQVVWDSLFGESRIKKDTKCFSLGKQLHLSVLQPDVFESEFSAITAGLGERIAHLIYDLGDLEDPLKQGDLTLLAHDMGLGDYGPWFCEQVGKKGPRGGALTAAKIKLFPEIGEIESFLCDKDNIIRALKSLRNERLTGCIDKQVDLKRGPKTTSKEGKIGYENSDIINNLCRNINEDNGFSQLLGRGKNKKMYSEVTLIWIENGMYCKAKLDGVMPEIVSDLKSTNDTIPDENNCKRTMRKYKSWVQATWYLNGMAAMKKLYKEGNLFVSECYDKAWVKDVMTAEKQTFVFIFTSTVAPHACAAWSLDPNDYVIANEKIDKAFETYKYCLAKYGAKKWPNGCENMVGKMGSVFY